MGARDQVFVITLGRHRRGRGTLSGAPPQFWIMGQGRSEKARNSTSIKFIVVFSGRIIYVKC